MTTIAIKDKVVASDSLSIGAFKSPVPCQKLFDVETEDGEKLIITGAGGYASIFAFCDWYCDGQDPDAFPSDHNENTYFVVVDSEGEIFSYEGYHVPVSLGKTYAFGSGEAFAMGAMYAGASSEEAVRIAMQLDPGSGGEVVVKKVGTA